MIAHCKPTNLSILWVSTLLLGLILLACGPANESIQREIGNLPPQPIPEITIAPASQSAAEASSVVSDAVSEAVQVAPPMMRPTVPPPVAAIKKPTEVPQIATPLLVAQTNTPPPDVEVPPTAPALQNDNENNPSPDPTTEPTATPTPEPTPTPERCLQGPGDLEICVADRVTARPTPQYPELRNLNVPVQETERKLREARERGDAESTVDVPNVFTVIYMEEGEEVQPVVDYLKSKNIPHMHDLGIEFSANGILKGTVAIYETYTGAAGRQHVYTVIPATLVTSVQSLVGVDKVIDGMQTYQGFNLLP